MSLPRQVTRYQSDPGQATAYMIGQLEIMKTRSYSKGALGDDFSLRDFHYQVRLLSLFTLFYGFSKDERKVRGWGGGGAIQKACLSTKCMSWMSDIATNGVQDGRIGKVGWGMEGVISMWREELWWSFIKQIHPTPRKKIVRGQQAITW